MKIKQLALSAALILSPYALAELPSFNYVEAGYTQLNGEEDFDAKGYGFEVSYEINENWYLLGAYTSLSLDDEVYENADDDGYNYYKTNELFKTDLSELTLGLGYRWQVSDSAYWAADLSYYKIEADVTYDFYIEEGQLGEAPSYFNQGNGSGSDSFNGIKAKVGYYANFSEQVAGVIGLTHKAVKIEGERETDSGFFADLSYKFSEQFAVSIGAEILDDNTYFVGGRYYF